MVFFTCGSCGSSLKKNQVEKHYKFQCKGCQYVSCMDCSKDFWGDSYATHLKCITEDQKYGGTNFVAKEFKGEKKQEAWTAKIQTVVATTHDMDPQLKALLNQIIKFDNIPRKKSKFENFLKNSAKIRNGDLVARAWKVFESATKDNASENCNGDSASQSGNENVKENGTTDEDKSQGEKLSKEERRKRKEEKKLKKLERKKAEEEAENSAVLEAGDVEADTKKSKKDKEKKKKEMQTSEEPEGMVVADPVEPETESSSSERKKKKRKLEEEVEHKEILQNGDVKTEAKKSKKKKKQQNDEEHEAMETGDPDEPKTEFEVKKKTKKSKRKQNLEAPEDVDNEVPKTADSETRTQELTKEQKKEERRKEKLARKEERRRVERENVVIEDTPVLNGKAKKKRKHEEKDRDDTDEQLPKKKKKKMCEDTNGAVEDQVNGEEHAAVSNGINDDSKVEEEEVNNNESSGSPFKWKVVIKKVLASAPEKRLKVTKLRKKVLAEYCNTHGSSGDSSESQSELYALFGQKIKSGKFVIDKDYVQMRS